MQVGLVGGMVVAVVLGLAAPAWPCVATLTGTVACSNTDHVAQWTLANGPVGGTMLVGTVTEQIGPDFYNVTGFTPTVLANGLTTGTSVIPGFETNLSGQLQISVWVRWPDDNFQTQVFAEIDLGRSCPGSTPPPTTTSTTTTYPNTTTTYPNTTTTYPNTTTTYPNTTTTYPNTTTTYPNTTTTCSWCNTTTTYAPTTTTYPATTTTCSWCNTTTTYPATTTTCSWCNTTTTYPATTTTVHSKPPTCDHLSATPGDGRAVVRWAAPSGSNSSITDYVVTTYAGSEAVASHMVTPSRTSDVVSGLANGKTYRFRVTAETPHGSGPPSGPTNAVTIGVPTAPTGVTAAARAGKAVVRWKAPSALNGSRLTGYIVTPYRNGVAQSARVVSAQSTRAKIAGLKAGQTYTFRVAALNHRGTGPQSDPSNAVKPK